MGWHCDLIQDARCGRAFSAALVRLSESDGYAAVRLTEWAGGGEWEVVRRDVGGSVVAERLADKAFWQLWRSDGAGCRSCGFSVRKGRFPVSGGRRPWLVRWRFGG